MTISATEPLVAGPYNGNGVTTVFSYSMTVFDESELLVFLRDADGVETLQTITTDYTVAPTGGTFPATGGTVTMLVAPPTGVELIILPDITRSQERPFSSQSSITLQEIEDALDKLTALTRQLYERSLRAVTVSAFDPAALDTLVNNINVLVALEASITTLVANLSTLQAVEDDLVPINTVATDIASIITVATNILSVVAVAADIADINTVAADGADIGTVAANIAAVNTVAANIASLLAAVLKTSATGSAILPVGTTAQRDGSPLAGYVRFNSTTVSFEGYNGTSWVPVGGGGLFKGNNGEVGNAPGDIFRINAQTLTVSTTIDADENASATGPLEVDTGVTLTVNGTLRIL